MADRLLTVQEIADRLQVNPQTVKAWLRTKQLRGLQVGIGRNAPWRMREDALADYIREREAAQEK